MIAVFMFMPPVPVGLECAFSVVSNECVIFRSNFQGFAFERCPMTYIIVAT